MAAGDLITRDGQYEFQNVLFNDTLSELDTLRVLSVTGLFDLPDLKGQERELDDDHGGELGRKLFAMRRIVMKFALKASTRTNMELNSQTVRGIFQPTNVDLPFVFQRAGTGKQFVNVQPSKFSGFDSDWNRAFGYSEGTVMLVAQDPRKFSMVQSSQPIIIPSSGLSNSGTVVHLGNFVGGARPILEIAGPATNPRIQNSADGGRTIRIDLVVSAGQTLILDARTRSVTMGGVDQSANVRTDNQWWNLLSGNNLITYTRSNNPASTSTLTVKWWDSWA